MKTKEGLYKIDIPIAEVIFPEDIGCFSLILLFEKVISSRGLTQTVSSSSARVKRTLLTSA